MIISKVRLRNNPGAGGALAKMLLAGAAGDRGHALVWSLFSETGDEVRRSREGRETPLFIFREIEPGAYMIVSRAAPIDPHNLWEIASKPYEPALSKDQTLGFVLRATPAISVKAQGEKRGERGRRVDAIMHAKYTAAKEDRAAVDVSAVALDWLNKRQDRLGVTFDKERCAAGGYRQIHIARRTKDDDAAHRVPRASDRKPITFSEIDYEGVLTVSDPEKFAQALFEGVGRAKSYGCGLMLVRPV